MISRIYHKICMCEHTCQRNGPILIYHIICTILHVMVVNLYKMTWNYFKTTTSKSSLIIFLTCDVKLYNLVILKVQNNDRFENSVTCIMSKDAYGISLSNTSNNCIMVWETHKQLILVKGKSDLLFGQCHEFYHMMW